MKKAFFGLSVALMVTGFVPNTTFVTEASAGQFKSSFNGGCPRAVVRDDC